MVSKEPEKEVVKQSKVKNNTQGEEDERLSFIKMMAGKSKPVEKVERPKKKVYTEPKEEQKPEVITKPIATPAATPIAAAAKPMAAPVVIAAPVVKVPVIIRTFKKPVWG